MPKSGKGNSNDNAAIDAFFKTRLNALEVKVSKEGGILTEVQMQGLEMKMLDDGLR